MSPHPTPDVRAADLGPLIDAHAARSAQEASDMERIRRLLAERDPWVRSSPLHVTGSAVVLHTASRRVLLRWHDRMQGWLQVGGHADQGETSPFAIARREAEEETGLADLVSWPQPDRPRLVHVVIVPVPAGKGEPDHEHADLRFVLATDRPDAVVPETDSARLRWLTLDDAQDAVAHDNLRETLGRVAELLPG